MKKLQIWWAQSKWIVWWILGGVATGLLFLLAALAHARRQPVAPIQLPEALKKKIDAAHEAALVKKVEAKVRAEVQQEELKEVASIDDGAERRKKLAEMLRKL